MPKAIKKKEVDPQVEMLGTIWKKKGSVSDDHHIVVSIQNDVVITMIMRLPFKRTLEGTMHTQQCTAGISLLPYFIDQFERAREYGDE